MEPDPIYNPRIKALKFSSFKPLISFCSLNVLAVIVKTFPCILEPHLHDVTERIWRGRDVVEPIADVKFVATVAAQARSIALLTNVLGGYLYGGTAALYVLIFIYFFHFIF